MATFEQNLAKIRGQAIYGPDMRTAIAEAIEQADDKVQQDIQAVDGRLENMRVIIDDHILYVNAERIGTTDDFLISITEGEVS